MRLIFLFCIFSLVLPCLGAEDETHAIDRFYDACVDKNDSTAGMLDCTEKAYKRWDAELNRVYADLLTALPAAKAANLKKAQRDWIVYRDSEFKAIGGIYDGLEGTIFVPAQAYSRLRVVRERTLLLTHYLELLKDAG
jgi:uncharacterized protein YecT (DUF1311 family)